MKYKDFKIGAKFWCGGHQWKCTDIGTRTIIAIQIDSAEVKRCVANHDNQAVFVTLSGVEAENQGWLNGPPYALAETVFDEYDFEGCSENE